jgi:hypothetical protein
VLGVQLALQLTELCGDRLRGLVGDVGVLLAAQPLDHVHVRRERDAAVGLVLGNDCGVLEVLRPDARDEHLRSARLRRHLLVQLHVDEGELQGAALQRGRDHVHRRRADEARDEQVDRVLVQLARRRDLLKQAFAHHGHPVAERHRLDLVVGHVDRGDAQRLLQPGNLRAHLAAQLRVQVGQGLVEEEGLSLADDGTAHGHPLALATGEVGRLALQVLVQLEQIRRLADAFVDLTVRNLGETKRERDVLVDREVGVKRVVLEHHRKVPVPWRLVVDAFVADQHVAGGDVLEPDDHAQQRGLTAAGWADQDHELAVGDVEADVVDRGESVTVLLDDVVHCDGSHLGDLL